MLDLNECNIVNTFYFLNILNCDKDKKWMSRNISICKLWLYCNPVAWVQQITTWSRAKLFRKSSHIRPSILQMAWSQWTHVNFIKLFLFLLLFPDSGRMHAGSFWRPLLCLAGEGNGIPLQYFCLENPMDGGAWWAAVHGVADSRTRLSDFTFTFHFHVLEKEMATHSSAWKWKEKVK